MSEEKTTIYYKGKAMIIYKSVAKLQGVEPFQSVNTDKFWEVLKSNSSHQLSICEYHLHPKN